MPFFYKDDLLPFQKSSALSAGLRIYWLYPLQKREDPLKKGINTKLQLMLMLML